MLAGALQESLAPVTCLMLSATCVDVSVRETVDCTRTFVPARSGIHQVKRLSNAQKSFSNTQTLVTGEKESTIHMASNSTMEPDDNQHNLMDNEKTTRLYGHLKDQRPVMINSKVPMLDDARAIIAADFYCICNAPLLQ